MSSITLSGTHRLGWKGMVLAKAEFKKNQFPRMKIGNIIESG